MVSSRLQSFCSRWAQAAAIAALLLLSTLAVQAQQDPLSGQSRDSGDSLLGGGEDDFLPVDEAFVLEARYYEGQLVLHWDIEPAYYLYRERFALTADPQPDGFEPRYSDNTREQYDDYFEKNMDVYYDSATIRIDVPEDAEPFRLSVQSQGCAEAGLCYPPHTDALEVDPESEQVSSVSAPSRETGSPPDAGGSAGDAWLPYILLLALLGGILLNLMPCVFPVLSIKVMSLAQADRERLPLHGWAYTAGIVLSFVVFAGILMAARTGGEAIGWGFQLQSPELIAALFYLFFILGLSLSGLLAIGTRWMGVGQRLTQNGGLGGSFFTGVLAAVVASPCTAPFMGAALGFALTQPALISLNVFIALGLGMALPLLALCYLPSLVRHLPRPGPWMDSLKQFFAFPLYLTAVWLLWVLGRQTGTDAVAAVATGAVAIAFAAWLMTRRPSSMAGRGARAILVLLSWVAVIALPWQALNHQSVPDQWEPYSAERLAQRRQQGRPVFINLTADWCITCLTNERVTLETEAVKEAFEERDVALLKGDWTNRDPAITELLENYGRSGVPLYLWFPENHQGQGHILPQLLRKDDLLMLLNEPESDLLSNK